MPGPVVLTLDEFKTLLYSVCIQHTVSEPVTIRIDLDSAVPAYRQIVEAVRIFLVSGKLKPGDALPSVRRLALDQGIHFNTVAEAYRALAEEGWLDLRRGRVATVVQRAEPPVAHPELVEDFRHRLRALVAEMHAEGASTAKLRAELRLLADEM